VLFLRVGCGNFLEESHGDRTRVSARAVTTTYTTVLGNSDRLPQAPRNSVTSAAKAQHCPSHGTTLGAQVGALRQVESVAGRL
jgi:hypothetical protein